MYLVCVLFLFHFPLLVVVFFCFLFCVFGRFVGALTPALPLGAHASGFVQVGDRVFFPPHTADEEPDALIKKTKQYTFFQEHFTTTDDCVAVYKDIPFTTVNGPVTVGSVVGAHIQ